LPAWRDYYYGIPVDGWYPDFIIVGPDLGLVVLEVKDGRLKSTWRHRSRRHHGLLKSRTAMQVVTA
jgi:hypothetical protein